MCVQPQSESVLFVGASAWEQAVKRKSKGIKKSFFIKYLGLRRFSLI